MRIQNGLYTVEVETKHGLITSIRERAGRYEILAESRLAENFRLLLPLPGLECNYVSGKDQRLTSCEKTSTGLRLEWKGPLRSDRGGFDVDVAVYIEFVGEAIHFRCDVVNRTKHKVAEVWYPILGGLRGIGPAAGAAETKALIPMGYAQENLDLFRRFDTGEQLGVPEGERTWQYPSQMSMAWVGLYHVGAGRGLYFAAHDTEARAKIVRFALHPGCAFLRRGNDWPTAKESGALPVGVRMNWSFFPYLPPGGTFQGPPIVLQAHAGDWRASARLYRQWFDRAFGVVDPTSHWMRRELVTLDTMFLLPEDNLNYTFADIPRWARTAADRGVKSVLISGWHVGGHDKGYPDYTPDPRLGTWEDLRKGLHACHKLGLKAFFFVNVQPVDMSSEWYRKELKDYLVTDPFGSPYWIMGFGMGTLGARAGLTRIPLTQMNPEHPRVREIFLGYMRKLAEIGVDGVHIDKYMATMLDFNPRLKRSPDVSHHKAMLETVQEMLSDCRRINPDFDFSYEGWWDRLMQYSDVTWWWPGPRHSVKKEVFPEWVPYASVTQPWCYNVVNSCVLKAHAMLVGPGNYTKDMDYEPIQELLKYITEVSRIRSELFDYVSTGEIADASDRTLFFGKPQVGCRGSFAGSPDAEWTLFRRRADGRLCAVLGNLGGRKLVASGLKFGGKRPGPCRIIAPFAKPRVSKLPATVTVPPERVVFVVEE